MSLANQHIQQHESFTHPDMPADSPQQGARLSLAPSFRSEIETTFDDLEAEIEKMVVLSNN